MEETRTDRTDRDRQRRQAELASALLRIRETVSDRVDNFLDTDNVSLSKDEINLAATRIIDEDIQSLGGITIRSAFDPYLTGLWAKNLLSGVRDCQSVNVHPTV